MEKNLLVLIIALYKNPNSDFQARPDLKFCTVRYLSPTPTKSQNAIHIYYVSYTDAYTCKRISWDDLQKD